MRSPDSFSIVNASGHTHTHTHADARDRQETTEKGGTRTHGVNEKVQGPECGGEGEASRQFGRLNQHRVQNVLEAARSKRFRFLTHSQAHTHRVRRGVGKEGTMAERNRLNHTDRVRDGEIRSRGRTHRYATDATLANSSAVNGHQAANGGNNTQPQLTFSVLTTIPHDGPPNSSVCNFAPWIVLCVWGDTGRGDHSERRAK